MSENVGASTSCNPKGLHGLYRDKFTFTYIISDRLLKNTLLFYWYGTQKRVEYHYAGG
jgi:hypothetical protein